MRIACKKSIPTPKRAFGVGSVFTVNGGRGRGGRFQRWQVVVQKNDTHAYLLVFDKEGAICGVQHYANYYLDQRTVVGHAVGLDKIALKVEFY